LDNFQGSSTNYIANKKHQIIQPLGVTYLFNQCVPPKYLTNQNQIIISQCATAKHLANAH